MKTIDFHNPLKSLSLLFVFPIINMFATVDDPFKIARGMINLQNRGAFSVLDHVSCILPLQTLLFLFWIHRFSIMSNSSESKPVRWSVDIGACAAIYQLHQK